MPRDVRPFAQVSMNSCRRHAWIRSPIGRLHPVRCAHNRSPSPRTAQFPRCRSRLVRQALRDHEREDATGIGGRAHSRYRDVQEHSLTNGILFRADVHKLFDSGYVT